MSWWQPHKFAEKRPYLEQRAKLMRAVRAYFDDQNFLEVETPILQTMPSADMHIHGFQTELWGRDLKPRETLYLQTSPEFDMKKLLVAGCKNIYQICKVFRNGEEGRLHSPEFTLVEWYRANAGYEDIMEDCIGLLRSCAETLEIKEYRHKGKVSDPFAEWEKLSVAEAFERYAGIDLDEHLTPSPDSLSSRCSPRESSSPSGRGKRSFASSEAISEGGKGLKCRLFAEKAKSLGIRITETDSWEDIFHAIMAEKIEPHLGFERPTILYDYPASMAALSRKKPDDPRFAERFELYVCGVELANAFGELTDAAEQRKRFSAEMQEKQDTYGFSYPLDEEFLKALEYGMPEAGGIALGIDRLVMLAAGVDDIGQVLWADKS